MAGCAATALLFRAAEPAMQASALAGAAIVLAAVAAWIDARWARWSRPGGGAGGAPA
jgi:hypothetical protein